ncbi:MAG: hypothetical protein ACE5FU_11920, partial [Nitrospinota bacterium]
EACFLGTPSIALPQNKFQEMTAKEVESRGATMLVERNKIVGGKKMSKVFKNLVDSFQVRSDISANGKKLIDGKGAHRVVRLVLDTYKDFLNNSKGEG